MSKEKKYLLYGMVLVLIAAMGLTFAYFAAGIEGSKKVINVTWADLKIVFNNGDAIQADNIKPGWSTTNTFSVENQTKNVYKYNIVIERLINTFVTTGFLKYKITSTDGGYNMTEFKDVTKRSTAKDTGLAYNIEIPGNTTHNYTIEFVYEASDTVDQSDDMGKVLKGNLYISKGTVAPTLANMMLRDNPTIKERTDFKKNTETTTGTIYKTNKTEDGSDVYYYSGNTTNNWVKFGGFYWRIIRTNEDGSVRILYSGTSHDTTTGYIGTSAFNSIKSDPMYVGYMYGTTGSLENNRTNTNDSTIKVAVDTWYENNLLTNYDKYLSKTAIYCNDRSVPSNGYSASSNFKYGVNTRIGNYMPSYKCGANTNNELFETTQATADKFSASTTGGGNGQLKYPIALMTADEVSFAGGISGTSLSSPYAWYYTNSNGNSIIGDGYWWLLSSFAWYHSTSFNYSNVFYVYGSSGPGLLFNETVNYSHAVRPAISLDSCVQIKSGEGTPESPYEIDYENSCN